MDDDDLILGFCCGGAGGSFFFFFFFSGWLIIHMSVFPHSEQDSEASIMPRSNYEEFFSVSSACAPLHNIISADF